MKIMTSKLKCVAFAFTYNCGVSSNNMMTMTSCSPDEVSTTYDSVKNNSFSIFFTT